MSHNVRMVGIRNTEDEHVSLERPGRTEQWGVRQARVVARGTVSPHPEEPRFGFPTLVARPTPSPLLTAPFVLLPYRVQCRIPGSSDPIN